jgi:hypothetical protein
MEHTAARAAGLHRRAPSPPAAAAAAHPHPRQGLATCSDDENYAVFGGATTSEPDTDEMMDGHMDSALRAGPPAPSPRFYANAAAAMAGGVGTDDDAWLFDIQRPAEAAGAAAGAAAVQAIAHPGCSGVAAYAMATRTTITTVTTTTTTTTTVAAAAIASTTTSTPPAAIDDADIDDLLADFKAARLAQQQRQQQQQQQQQRNRSPSPAIERVSLAQLGGGGAAVPERRAAVTFFNTLPPRPAVNDGPLQYTDGPQAAVASVAMAAAQPPLPPPPIAAAANNHHNSSSKPARWAPARPISGMTAVVGPGASAAYEDEALSFSRARRRPVAAAPAAGPRHPGM